MSAHFLLHVIPLHFLFITLFIFFSLRTKLHFGQSWVQSSPPALLPALKKGDVGRLHVEISMVYLVYSTLSSLANQNIGLSAEVSLIYSEYNDGLQNYSFKFLSFCFDFWPLAGFWLKHCAEFISEMLRLLPFVWWKHSRYETEQEADFFLGSSVDNSQMWPLQDKVHVPQGRERRIKNCAERKHVRLVSATSRFLICVLPFASANFSSGYFPHWTSERQIHMNALSGCVAGTCWRCADLSW